MQSSTAPVGHWRSSKPQEEAGCKHPMREEALHVVEKHAGMSRLPRDVETEPEEEAEKGRCRDSKWEEMQRSARTFLRT